MSTKRRYVVLEPSTSSTSSTNGCILRVSRSYAKRSKDEKRIDFSRYADVRYAQCDASRLEAHFKANKRHTSFEPDYDGSIYMTLSQNERSIAALVVVHSSKENTHGVVAKQKSQRDDRMYRKYANKARKTEEDVLPREVWDDLVLQYAKYLKFARMSGTARVMDRTEWFRHRCTMDRDLRALSRNRQTRESYFMDCINSRDARKRAKGVDNARRYMSERQCKLTADCEVYEKHIVNLLDAIHGSKTYTKDIKAKYVDLPGELIDLTDEPDFTLETISQAQLARVGSQCDAVYRMFEARKVVAMKELELIAADLKDLHESHDVLAVIEAFDAKKKILLQENAMLIIADKVSKDLRGHLAGRTILQYFNEYLKYNGFKEDLRGKHQRLFFLDVFNYTKRWEHWLKYTPHVSVQAVTDALEAIIQST